MPVPYKHVRKGFEAVNSAWKQLEKTSKDIEDSPGLNIRQSNRYNKVMKSRTQYVPKGARKQQKFLNKVLAIDPIYHALCTIAFTQSEMDSTTTYVLNGLLEEIKKRRDDPKVIHSGIRSLAANLKRRTVGAEELCYEFNHAELEGSREVFGEAMVDKIKSVQMNSDWRSVTISFPMWPTALNLDPCVLSLDIREKDVQEIAMALFEVQVDWKETDEFHVFHKNGMVQIIPHHEFTLKGVADENIIAVFNPMIHGTINECSIRAKELAEGKGRTECVSMTFIRGGGTISLKMGLERGIEVQNKLYPKRTA